MATRIARKGHEEVDRMEGKGSLCRLKMWNQGTD